MKFKWVKVDQTFGHKKEPTSVSIWESAIGSWQMRSRIGSSQDESPTGSY